MPRPHSSNEENSSPALPPEIPAFLVRIIPPRTIWKWLQNEERSGLLDTITRGFQKSATVLRQPIVRSRLSDILLREEKLFANFLQLWGETTPAIVKETETLPEDNFLDELRALTARNGLAATTAALLYLNRQDALEQLDTIEEPEVTAASGATSEITSTHEETSALQKQLKEAHKRVETVQRRADENQKRVETLKTELATQKSQSAQETRELQTRLKAAERNSAKNEADLTEAQKRLDRAERRLRQSETTLEETQAENKRLHRQLRQSQQLHEELRKQIAGLTLRLREIEETAQRPKPSAKPETTPTPEIKSSATSTQNKNNEKSKTSAPDKKAPPSANFKKLVPPPTQLPDIHPLDQAFVWNADGRTTRITARELMNFINCNDEEQVYPIVQAMDALRDQSIEGYRLFLSRVREAGRYYGRVLTTETTRVLVDASNVARYEKDARGRGQLCNLLSMREELRRRDCFPIKLIADASLPFNIDERNELLAMAKRGEVEIAPAGIEADEILAREARRTGAYVVTNDRNFHLKVTPDFEPPRLSFRVRDSVVTLEDF
jgi:chemotaxis protein histidine kinase CheA